MTNAAFTPGRIVWRELMTTDVARARAFYSEVFGWKIEDDPKWKDAGFGTIVAGGKAIGAMWGAPEEEGVTSAWMSFVSVPDVDAAANAATANGGTIDRGPAAYPGVGRYAVLLDFAGAMVLAFRRDAGDPTPERPKPGELCWETLSTNDVARAKQFYGAVFGWKTTSGGNGEVPVFTMDGTSAGIVADIALAKSFPPRWLTYVAVEQIETTRDRARSLGAAVPLPLLEIDKVGRIALIVDPTGAALGLFQAA